MSVFQKILTFFGLEIIKITGASMAPVFQSNDYVIIKHRAPNRQNYAIGSYLILDHPHYGRMIKRVHQPAVPVGFYVTGENTSSTAQDKLGVILPEWIYGHVIYHIPEQGRPKRPKKPKDPAFFV